MDIVQVKNINKIYEIGLNNKTIALQDVNISIEEGEFVSIIGTSGSGKSTLLHIIGGLDKPTSGSVNIKGKCITNISEAELTSFRRKNIGFVFQKYNLISSLTVYENIVLPLQLDNREINIEYVNEIINTLGLSGKINSYINQLSGGQQQRVAIARALVSKPAIILADEPTGNLDSKNTMQVMNILQNANKKYGQTIIMITHNEELTKICDRVIRIEDGKIKEN